VAAPIALRFTTTSAQQQQQPAQPQPLQPPPDERPAILERHHLLGHFGADAMTVAIHAEGMDWPGLKADALAHCQRCVQCLRFLTVPRGYHPLKPITADQPFDHVAVDLAGPFMTSASGNHYLHVLVDIHSRFVLLHAIPDKRMETVALLWRDTFCTFGFPRIIQSDNGTEFVNQVARALTQAAGIDHRLITPYHPRANGAAERTVQTATRLMKKLAQGAAKDWDTYLPFIQYCINQKISRRHQHAPFAVVFGRQANAFADFTDAPLPVDFAPGSVEHQEFIAEVEARANEMAQHLFPLVTARSKTTANAVKDKFDKEHKLVDLPVDSFVMLRDEQRRNKSEPPNIGPFKIVNKTTGGAYVLQDLVGALLPRNYQPSALISLSTDPRFEQNSFEVESILDHQDTVAGYKYLVRWKGYSQDHDTWEPEDNFDDLSVIHAYWHRRGQHPRRD
jgi:transposase InsO family protein